jgi:uncharacterized membrane protein
MRPTSTAILKSIARLLLAAIMIFVGMDHFRHPEPFIGIVPNFLPAHRALVLVSGFFEILGGVGLLIPIVSRLAAWGLIALYVAVFPANINMAINDVPINGHHFSPAVLWLRLPFQIVLIAWAWWFTRPNAGQNSQK